MARAIHKLTPAFVERKSKIAGVYGDGGGLYLRVSPPSARSWVFRFMLAGKAREMGLGSYPEVSLPEARERARDGRERKAKGHDPIDARESERASLRLQAAKAVTFRQCAESYIAAHKDTWTNKTHAAQWKASLANYVLPILGDVPVGDIDRGLVVRVLEPIWKAKTETASRVRGRIEAVLDWAAAREYRSAENPARRKGALAKLFPARSKARTVKHLAALPYPELPAFMERLKAHVEAGADALRLTILTAIRTAEAIGATWAEVDFDRATWTIPASRTKAKREHRIPLSKPALSLLRTRYQATGGVGHIFPGQRPKNPISSLAMLNVLKRMGRGDITVHGFRSTFRDWVEETTNHAGTVAEAVLGHVIGDRVEAAYRRGDLFEKRRKLMTAWATFCTTPKQDATVIPIDRRGKAASG